MNAKDKIATGRAKARSMWRYMDAALYSLVPYEAPGFGTLGVSHDWKLFYDPEIVAVWTIDELATVLLHEVSHLLRNHPARREKIGVTDEWLGVWGQAADCEIDDDLIAAGFRLPTKPFTPCWPQNMGLQPGLTAEFYFRELQKRGHQPAPNQYVCGSCRDGHGASDKAGGNPPPGSAGGGRSEAESNRIRQTVAEAIVAHTKSQGRVPGGWVRWAGEMTKPPVVRWQDQLAHIARSAAGAIAGATDYSFSRLSRRQAGVGFGIGRPVIPSLRSPRPLVKFAVDTSGSMSDQNVADAVIEAGGILKSLGCPIEFLACDAAVHATKQVRTIQDIIPLIKGGGGTDFHPIFDHITKTKPRPDLLVIGTDGGGSAPTTPPPYRVIWLLVNKSDVAPVPWGKTIHVKL